MSANEKKGGLNMVEIVFILMVLFVSLFYITHGPTKYQQYYL